MFLESKLKMIILDFLEFPAHTKATECLAVILTFGETTHWHITLSKKQLC